MRSAAACRGIGGGRLSGLTDFLDMETSNKKAGISAGQFAG